jgi:iron complex transport system substrate-binding protein
MLSPRTDRFHAPAVPRRHVGQQVVGLLLMLCLHGVTVPAPALPSVASTNLCADLLLLPIAAPGQIVSVSLAAADPALSPLASHARAYPGNRGSVEELLLLRPDLALVYQGWTGRGHRQLLDGRGTRVVPLPYPSGWEGSLQSLRDLAGLIGRDAYAEDLIQRAEQRMRQLADRTPPLRVLYLRPNGGTAGQDTYVDDLLQRLGLRNVAAEEGLRGWGRFPLERLVSDPPDLFLLGYFDQEQARSKTAFARHPLFRDMLARIPAISVPAGGWGCGGVELVAVAEDIVGQIDDLQPADAR